MLILMFMQGNPWVPDGGHLVELMIAGITFWGISWGYHREDKKDRQEKAVFAANATIQAAKQLEEKQERRHRENQKRLARIFTKLNYNPPHVHTERSGQLTVDGLRYSPNTNDEMNGEDENGG